MIQYICLLDKSIQNNSKQNKKNSPKSEMKIEKHAWHKFILIGRIDITPRNIMYLKIVLSSFLVQQYTLNTHIPQT